MRGKVLVVGVSLLFGCRKPVPPSPPPTDASAAPTCTSPIVVRARVHGAFEGSPTSGVRGPAMVVGMQQGPSFDGVGPSFGTVAELALEAPRFAAEYAPSDLCSDEGSSNDRIAISCITGPGARTTKVVVARGGTGLEVTVGDARTRWTPPETTAATCFELHGLEDRRDLDVLRKTWMLDTPKCPRSPSAAPVKIALVLDPLATTCSPGGAPDRATVTLIGAGPPRALGRLGNTCGYLKSARAGDVNGIAVEAGDMGTERRFAYQLGDRVYYASDDGRVHAAELPCGARASFEVRPSGRLRVSEQGP